MAVCVLSITLPETTATAPYSPSARASVRTTPYPRAQRIAGSVTRRNVWSFDAPRVQAACSCSSPISSRTGATSRTTNGKETKIVAITIPGIEKITSMPWSASQLPVHVFGPYTRISASPTTTGDTASGMSTKALSSRLPGNR